MRDIIELYIYLWSEGSQLLQILSLGSHLVLLAVSVFVLYRARVPAIASAVWSLVILFFPIIGSILV